MRPDASEVGNQQGGRGRARARRWSWLGARRARARRPEPGRVALEALEERQLLATVPAPTILDRSILPTTGVAANDTTSNESDPSIAVDRYNPQHLAAVWVRSDPDINGGNQPDIIVEGAYSVDGGQSWRSLAISGSNLLRDPNIQNAPNDYVRVTDPSVAFDAQGNVYFLTLQSNGGGDSGALVLDKYDLSGGFASPVFTGRVVHQWVPSTDSATNPMLAVDDGPLAFVDPTTGARQDNPNSGTVYVAWASIDDAPGNNPSNYNPNRILLVSSSDGGATFGGWSVINDNGNSGAQRNTRPRLAVAQGTSPVTRTYAAPAGPQMIPDSGLIRSPLSIFSLPSTGRIDDIDVTVSITHPRPADLQLTLIAPDGTRVALASNRAGAYAGTTFDDQAALSIASAPGPFSGSFRPEQPLSALNRQPAGALNGVWQLEARDTATGQVGILNNWSMDVQSTRLVAGGVTVVWDDFGTRANNSPPVDRILSDRVTAGVNANFSNGGGAIADATTTDFTFDVAVTDPRFLTLADLDVALSLTHPAIQELRIQLIAPDGTTVTLLQNQIDSGGASNTSIGVSGANLGVVNGVNVPTVFDDQATRRIVDFTTAPPARGAGAPFAGHFRPELGSLSVFNGRTPAQLNGTWTLRITDSRSGNTGSLRGAELKFRSGLAAGADIQVATTRVMGSISDGFSRNTTINPNGVGPNVVVAQDNTLGAFSPFQGRLYVAYVDWDNVTNNPADNTDIYLVTSDDGGLTWSSPVQVNDDAAVRDGFSEAQDAGTTSLTGRPQFQPNVAVDQATGTLVLSWYDARNDAARARVATYLTASIDGGATFSEQVFANAPRTAVDAITGRTVVFGPIPDNQSPGNDFRETTFGFGDNQGLAVHGGRIYPIWSGNQNGGPNPNTQNRLDIYTAVAAIAAGPRVVDSTMGAVGLTDQFGAIVDPVNNQTTADGTPIVAGFDVTFDRPIDPATFRPEDVRVFFRDATAADVSGGPVPVTDVVPIATPLAPQFGGAFDPSFPDQAYNFDPVTGAMNVFGYTKFRVVVAPRSAVGTYSYAIGPDISDRIRGPQSVQFDITPVGARQTFGSTDVPIAVPDLGTITSDLTIPAQPAGRVIQDLDVTLTVAHGASSDLVLTLIAPNGVRIALARNQGFGTINAFAGTTFDDEAATSIAAAFPPYTASYRPIAPLDQLDGLPLEGTWQLEVADTRAFGTGTLQNWSLDIQAGQIAVTGAIGAAGNRMDQDADAAPGEVPTTGVGVGDVYAAPRPTTEGGGFQYDPTRFFAGPYDPATLPLILSGPRVVASRVPGTPQTGDNLVLNRPVSALDVTFDRDMAIDSFTGADVLRIYGPGGELIRPTPFVAPGVNQAIPDRPAAGAALPLISTLEIPGDGTFRIADLDVRLDLQHADTSQLTVELVSPRGTRVTLLSGVAGTRFAGTVLDDESPLTIAQGAPPYTGRFRASGALSDFDGQELRGTWRLVVTDNAPGGTGVLRGWSLEATPLPQVAPAFNATAVPADPTSSRALSIPIPNGQAITSTLIVPAGVGGFTIADLNVTLDISHLRPRDLSVALEAPDGTLVPLFAGIGGDLARDFRNTTLDDQADTAVDRAPSTSFTGIYRPQAAALATLNGKAIQGTWKLHVADTADAQGTGGTLNSWSLTATPADATTAAARTFRVSFPTQRIGGTYSLTLGPDILSRNGDAMDTNTNAGVDLLRGTASAATVPTVPVIANSADVPKAIPDSGKITSLLTVPENFLIADLNVRLNITHANDPDLTVVLIAPDGTQITLFSGVGDVPGNRANFADTTLDDQATLPIQEARAPFAATYNPQQPLGALNGTNAAGTWALEITDNTPGGNGVGARLNSWSLLFARPVPNTGLGEPVADRTALSFRVFRMDPADPLSGAVWTPTGPASTTASPSSRQGYTGRISTLAVDPSDPSGNTVYAGAAAGGVWRTNNFLTTDPDGPTWTPLTDFGPTFGLNIGSIAVYGRNNDPNQSILIAGTGEAAGQFGWGSTGGANADGNTSRGVGFLLSTDGGATWTLLDSRDNSLPFDDPNRDHWFALNNGTATFKVVVDPTPPAGAPVTIDGRPVDRVTIYAAMSGPNGGLWRSTDTGLTWQKVSQDAAHGTDATDVTLDLNSRGADGKVDTFYAAFAGHGVYRSSINSPLTLMTGQVGVPQLRDTDLVNNPAVSVANLPSPNGGFGRIALARPALVPATDPNAAVKNILYQGWLYAAVANTNGTLQGVYLTKDFGQTWTQLQIPTELRPNESNGVARPSNDPNNPEYDTIASPTFRNGQYNLSLVVDPNNPEIVYLGGTSVGQNSGLIRIDVSRLHDAHALVGFDDSLPDGGQRTVETNDDGAAVTRDLNVGLRRPARLEPPFFTPDPNQYTNLIRDPDEPFRVGSNILLDNTLRFNNDGVGVRWTPLDAMLLARATDFTPSTNIHQAIAVRDPLTGNTRLIFGDDQGVFTGVDAGDGTIDPGIGTLASPTYSRVGNLQTALLYQGAAQPTLRDLQGQLHAALFYGMAQGTGYPTSDPDILGNGNDAWLGLNAGELDGSDVATDPQGRGIVYQYKWPGFSDNATTFTDFFQVNGVPRTFGLIQTGGSADPQWPSAGPVYPGLIAFGRFAVNPVAGDQLMISSNVGRLFATTNQAAFWSVIAEPGDLDGTYAPALAYGAPDPTAPGGVGNLAKFLYAGTIGGHIFVTRTGGGAGQAGAWQDISAGLDGSSVVRIVTSPDRGSHEAYAVTLRGVYYTPDSLTTPWTSLTGDLFAIDQAPFGDATAAAQKLSFLTSLRADWRYAIPEDFDDPASRVHPILYVAGDAGVYRLSDFGFLADGSAARWELFPGVADGAPRPGGYLPSVAVTDLDMALGRIDPDNGRPVVGDDSPNVLLASTFGRGSFAIRLAPQVLPDSLRFGAGSDSGASDTDRVTNVLQPTFEGLSAQTASGSTIVVQLIDLTDPANPAIIGTGTTGPDGRFSIAVDPGYFRADGSTDGLKTIGVQAIDQAGTRGNVVQFQYTLDTQAPAKPGRPVLQPGSDSGALGDNITNATAPVFDVATGEPATTVLTLYRGNTPVNSVNVDVLAPATAIADPGPVQPDGTYRYTARLVDLAGNQSPAPDLNDPNDSLLVTIDTTPPTQPAAPKLEDGSNTGSLADAVTSVRQPWLFGDSNGATIELLDAAGQVIGTAPVVNGKYRVQPDANHIFNTDGTFDLRVQAIDVAGNPSTPSPALRLTIQTAPPITPTPTLALVAADDSGVIGDNITNVLRPRVQGDAAAGQVVELLLISSTAETIPAGTPKLLASGVASVANTYGISTPFRPGVDLLPAGVTAGDVVLQVRVRDTAGNVALSNPLALSIRTAFASPTTLRLNPADDNLRPGDNITTRRRPTFIGTTQPGATVQIVDGTGPNARVLATGRADSLGRFSLVLANELTNGTIPLWARAVDTADNVGPLSDQDPTTPAVADPLRVTIASARDDYDGDGKADPSVFRPSPTPGQPGLWAAVLTGGGRFTTEFILPAGLNFTPQPGDIPVSGDFDGDGKTDPAVFRSSNLTFYIQQTKLGPAALSIPGWPGVDQPAPADYDGDGKTDLATYSPVGGYILVLRSSSTPVFYSLNAPNATPVPADFDGDGKADAAAFDPASATWTILTAPNGVPTTRQLGAPRLDVPIPADYDGDGKADLALFRPDSAEWIVVYSGGGTTYDHAAGRFLQFGWPGVDLPTPSDYDGDGKADVSLYRPTTGQYLTRLSGGGVLRDPSAAPNATPFPFPQPFNPAVAGDLPIQSPYGYRRSGGQTLLLGSATASRAASIPGQPAVTAQPAVATTAPTTPAAAPAATVTIPVTIPVAPAPPAPAVPVHGPDSAPATAWDRLRQYRRDRLAALLAARLARRP